MTGQRILGLDVGDRTVGVAASDLLLMTAQGVETIRRETLEKDLSRLDELMREYDAVKLVVGLPRNMNGTEGPRAERAKKFVGLLEKQIACPVAMLDERLSTKEASRYLNETNTRGAKRKQVIDKLSAQIILQAALDRLKFLAQQSESSG